MTLTELLENEEFRSGRKWGLMECDNMGLPFETGWFLRVSGKERQLKARQGGGPKSYWINAEIWGIFFDASWRLVDPEKE